MKVLRYHLFVIVPMFILYMFVNMAYGQKVHVPKWNEPELTFGMLPPEDSNGRTHTVNPQADNGLAVHQYNEWVSSEVDTNLSKDERLDLRALLDDVSDAEKAQLQAQRNLDGATSQLNSAKTAVENHIKEIFAKHKIPIDSYVVCKGPMSGPCDKAPEHDLTIQLRPGSPVDIKNKERQAEIDAAKSKGGKDKK